MRWSHLCIREIYGLEPWLAVEESRVREATRQRKTMRGRESTRAGEVYIEGDY